MFILQARDLSVPPASSKAVASLEGPVSVGLTAGDVVAVLGPSGSGKTTFLRCLAMLEPRAQGDVFFRNELIEPSDTPAFRRLVAYLPQQPPAVPMKVEDALAHPFSFRSAKGADFDRGAAKQLCGRLLLPSDVMNRWSPDLSVGESQRIALVRTMLTKPQVLLLDEFTSAMDPAGMAEAERLVTEWLKEGERAAVLVSHDSRQRTRLANRTITLEQVRPETMDED